MSVKNATILDRIWLEGTNDYQQRVPQASQQGVAAVAEFLFNPMNKMYYNQFVDALVNRIGMTRINSRIWDNPLTKFKKGNLPYGSTVQDLGIKWIKAHSYRDDLDTLLEVNRPLVEQAFYTLNRRDQYPISTNYDELRNAFVDEYGLNKLINSITDVPISSDNYDEYIIMKQLVAEYESRYGFFKEQISAITNEQTAKDFLVKARAYAGRLKFPSVYYNLVDIPTFASEQELVLFIDPTSLAYVDVQALAAAFNIDKAEIKYRIEVIDEWPIPGAVALLTTEDFFQVYDVLYSTTSFYNPQTLTTNYYLNHWEIIAFSPFVPAILFTTAEGTSIETLRQRISGFTVGLQYSSGETIDGAALKSKAPDGIIHFVPELTGTFTDSNNTTVNNDNISVKPDTFLLTFNSRNTTGQSTSDQSCMIQYSFTSAGSTRQEQVFIDEITDVLKYDVLTSNVIVDYDAIYNTALQSAKLYDIAISEVQGVIMIISANGICTYQNPSEPATQLYITPITFTVVLSA